jgi:Salmonella virulence plasmid 65kDa B protein
LGDLYSRQADTSAAQVGASPSVSPEVSLTKSGSAIRESGEKFAANPVIGIGKVTLPIARTPGSSGFGPRLSLTYDSGAGNGPVGFGGAFLSPRSPARQTMMSSFYRTQKILCQLCCKRAGGSIEILAPREERLVLYVYRYRPRIERLFARIERRPSGATGDTFCKLISKYNVTGIFVRTRPDRHERDQRVFRSEQFSRNEECQFRILRASRADEDLAPHRRYPMGRRVSRIDQSEYFRESGLTVRERPRWRTCSRSPGARCRWPGTCSPQMSRQRRAMRGKRTILKSFL